MVYKTILLSLIAFALYGQIMLNPNRANTLNPPAGGGGGGGIPTIVYTDSVSNGVPWGTATNIDTIQFTHWGSIQANDLIILLVSNEDGAADPWTSGSAVSEAGYTLMFTGGLNGLVGLGGFYKVATGSEAGTFIVTAVQSTEQIGYYIVLRGADASNPIDSIGARYDVTPAADTCDIPQILTQAANCLVISVAGYDGGDWSTVAVTGTTGWTFWSAAQARANANEPGLMWGYKEQASIGETGICVFDVDLSDQWVGIIFSVKGAE